MSARSGFEMVGRGISSQDLYRSRDGSCEFSARLLVSHVRGNKRHEIRGWFLPFWSSIARSAISNVKERTYIQGGGPAYQIW